MPRSFEAKRRRQKDIVSRASVPDDMWKYCRIIGCSSTTRAGAGKGLNRKYCRSHEEAFQRHGSHTAGSLPATAINPARRAAEAFLMAHEGHPTVAAAVAAVRALYRQSGATVEAFRQRGLSPAERAGACWSRLRDDKVSPETVIAVWLAVQAVVDANPSGERKPEFREVQAAKVLHRMVGGSYRRWEREDSKGRVHVQELHKHTHSRGQILRHLGGQLNSAAAGVDELRRSLLPSDRS